jgi:hypothetical protein
LAGAGAGLAGLATPASATIANQWRIEHLWTARDGYLESIAASGPSDAWAVGTLSSGGALAAHWNGRTWQTVTIPGTKDYDLMQVAASSARNVWVFGQHGVVLNAFRFDGAHWHTVSLPPVSGIGRQDGKAVVFGAKDVWLATWGGCTTTSGKKKCSSDVWHWNGSAWTNHPVAAAITGFTGISDLNLRAVALTGQKTESGPGTVSAYQWHGSRWTGMPIPLITGPSPATTGIAPDIAMDSSGDIWIASMASCCTVTAIHSTSSGWKKLTTSATNSRSDLTLDGHGGAWLGSFTHWTGHGWAYVQDNLYQFNASSWQIYDMVKVPGTAGSYWIAGFATPWPTSISRPMVAVYGPTP